MPLIIAGAILLILAVLFAIITDDGGGSSDNISRPSPPSQNNTGRSAAQNNSPPPIPPRRNGRNRQSVSPTVSGDSVSGGPAPPIPHRANRPQKALKPIDYPCCPICKAANNNGARQKIFFDRQKNCYFCERGHKFERSGRPIL